jgi:tRNA(Ile)-lysidine synthase
MPDRPALIDRLLARCTFPADGAVAACAFSGGGDSTALLALAIHAGLEPVAHHVDHSIRPESAAEAEQASALAAALGVAFVLHRVTVEPGANLEARARAARRSVLPPAAMTGHTADDQAETVLLRLLRGSGGDGLAAIAPGPTHPILALRRSETAAVCAQLGLEPVDDASNRSPAMWRNRVRHELLPLACEIADRDVVPIVARTARLLGDDQALLDELAPAIDATDARAIAAAHPALARRALRRWLSVDGYPPDAASIERVLAVAHGSATACQLDDGRRVERSRQRFRIVTPGQ